jgi:hypothetical protein
VLPTTVAKQFVLWLQCMGTKSGYVSGMHGGCMGFNQGIATRLFVCAWGDGARGPVREFLLLLLC